MFKINGGLEKCTLIIVVFVFVGNELLLYYSQLIMKYVNVIF